MNQSLHVDASATEQVDRFEQALIVASMSSPFLRSLLSSIQVRRDDSAVDSAMVCLDPITIVYNGPFFNSLTFYQALGVLFHEVLHLVQLSFSRGKAVQAEPQLWNIAADAVINGIVLQTTLNNRALELPPQGVFLKDLQSHGFAGEPVHESIYQWLLINRPTLPPTLDDHRHLDQFLDKAMGITDEELVSLTLEDLIKKSLQKGWGKFGGDMIQHLEQYLRPSRSPWKLVLRQLLTTLLGPEDRDLRVWSRPSPRREGLPSWRSERGSLIVAVDVSGSVYNLLPTFLREVEAIARGHRLTLLFFDVKITAEVRDYRLDKILKSAIVGGGGTDVQCLFDWMAKRGLVNEHLVVLTDGQFSRDFTTRGVHRILWAVLEGGWTESLPGLTLTLPWREVHSHT